MSDYDSDSNGRGDDVYDFDSDIGYHIGGPEYARNEESYHSSEFLYSISDHLFGERKRRAPVEVEAGEEVNQVVNPVVNQAANPLENQPDSPVLIPIYVISSDEESVEDVPVPEKSRLEPFSRDVLKRRIEKIGQGFEQRRAYLDNRQDRDVMAPCPIVAPYLPPSKKHRRSFSF